MKRILALVIAALLLMSIGVSAMAAPKPSPAGTFTFKKTYTSSDGETWPEETLKFKVTAKSNNPDGGKAKIKIGTKGDDTYDVISLDNDITVSYPEFSKAGVYRFTIEEVPPTPPSQGVDYNIGKDPDKNVITVSILVAYDKNGNLIIDGENDLGAGTGAGCDVPEGETEKNDKFENKYTFGGDDGESGLTVKKVIEGNLADPNKYFTMKVTFNSPNPVRSTIVYTGGQYEDEEIKAGWKGKKEITLELKGDDTVTFKKIPVGVTYTVVEDKKHLAAGDKPTQDELNSDDGYLVDYEDEAGEIEEDTTHNAVVTNTKKTEIVTGITLETLPYILILAVVVIGGAFAIIRRRKSKDE